MSAALPTNAEQAPAELATVVLEGSPQTYDVRNVLRALGLRWDRAAHHWHGSLRVPERARLEAEFHLPIQLVEVLPPVSSATPTVEDPQGPVGAIRWAHANCAEKRPWNGSRTGQMAIMGPKGGSLGIEEEDGVDGRRFSILEVTSGLPDDSRDSDEHFRALIQRQRRGRVAAAQAALEAHPEARELVMRDQTKQRLFCARFGITPQDLCPHAETDGARIVHPGSPRDGMCGWCHGRHGWQPIHVDDVQEVLASPYDRLGEVRARAAAFLPYLPEGDGAGWGVRGGPARA